MVSLVPKSIMLATAGGIGLFLAFIGMQNSNGIGLITYNSATLVTLGKLTLLGKDHHASCHAVWPAGNFLVPSKTPAKALAAVF
jgi:hypothetical protein